nr:glycosyltransferase family 4 protein [Enterococcus cecorum]
MKINIILPSIGTSGGMEVIYRYASLLNDMGHDVVIYKEIRAFDVRRFKLKSINLLHQYYCTCKAVISRLHKENKFDKFVWKLTDDTVRNADIIVATAWPTAFIVNKLSKSKGKKYYFIQGYEVYDNEKMAAESYNLPLRKIVISNWINSCLKKDLGIGPFPVVWNGIDTDIFYDLKVRNHNKQINFLMLNHILPEKGVNFGLEAYAKILEKHPTSKLRMFGMCDNSNLPKFVEYYRNPSKEKLVELYSKSDIFIFPSIVDGWGLTPIEAIACGCIVVGSNVGVVYDLGKNEENMMISSPGDVDEMYKNIEKLLKYPNLFDNIQQNSKNVISKLDWNLSAKKLEKIFIEG